MSNDGQVPWAARRNGVKDERRMEQIWVQESTSELEDNVKSEVEDILGYNVYLTDFKEAAYLHGLENPLEIATQLEEWGCEYA